MSYRIYRGGSFIGTSTATTYTDSGLSPLQSYNYTVSAVNAQGVEGPPSASETGTTQAAGANTPLLAVYPLELVSPRQVGTAPIVDLTPAELAIQANQNDQAVGATTFPAAHRTNYAYPGLTYNVRGVAIGGSYPHTWALTANVPSGMSINARTGEITWANPQASANDIGIRVTDAMGTVRDSVWSITVGTSGWYFVNAAASEGGDGSLASPWNSFTDFVGPSAAAMRVYLMSGTYTAQGVSASYINNSGSATHCHISSNYLPNVMIAYPGHSPVYDCLSGSLNCGLHWGGTGYYLDGLRVTNHNNMLMRAWGGHYRTLRRCTLDTTLNGYDGSNSAAIMFESGAYGDGYRYYTVIQDCTFHTICRDSWRAGAVRMYCTKKALIEDCYAYGVIDGLGELKSATPRTEIRGCRVHPTNDEIYPTGTSGNGIGGNFSNGGSLTQLNSTEIRYNHFRVTNSVANPMTKLGASCTRLDFYRNTVYGTPWSEAWYGTCDQRFYNNVIVNNYSTWPDRISFTAGNYQPITDGQTTAPSYVARADNLAGDSSAGIIDSNGALQGIYSTYVGTRGWEIP